MMIKWTGKSTNGLWRKEAQAETMMKLYNKLVDIGAIRLEDYDPIEKHIIESAGLDYSEAMEEAEEFSSMDEYFDEKKIDTTITDEDLCYIISEERGNAFYQTFEDQDGHELKFDMNGKLRDLRSEKIWFSFDNKGNIGAHDAYYEDAEADAEANAKEYPDDEWTFDVQD